MTYRFAPFIGFTWIHLLLLGGLVILFVVLVVLIVRRPENRPYGPPPHWPPPQPPPGPGPAAPPMDPALQILRERFARGEISEAEYLSARSTLTGPMP